MTDNTGQYKAYTEYDAIDRLKEYRISDPYGSGGALTYRTKYEGTDEEGVNLIEKIDPFGSETFTYDRFNNIASATRSWNTSPAIADKTFSYVYDIQNRITQTTYPSGIEVQHTYLHDFETARLISHPDGSGTYVSQPYPIRKQQASDQPVLATVSVPDIELTVSFRRQTSPIRISQHVFDFDGVASTRNYRFGRNGQINQIHYDNQAASQITVDFSYDHLQRLVSQTKDGATELAYAYLNDAGDIDTATTLTPMAGTYTYSYHETASAAYRKGLRRPKSRTTAMGLGREDFAYDGFGRMTRWDKSNGHQRSFTYDGISRLRGVVIDGDLKHVNKYDFDGNLIETAVFDGGSQPIRRYKAFRSDATVSPAKETEKINNVLLVDVSDPQDHIQWWLLKELHGDVSKWYARKPQQQSDAAGRRRLNMAGETVWEDGEPYDDESFHGAPFIDTPHGVDLFHIGARHLARRDGMWLQPEPLLYLDPGSLLADPQGLSPYRYAKNNPVNFTDPDGYGNVKVDVANRVSLHANSGSGWSPIPRSAMPPSDEIIYELVKEVTEVAPEVSARVEKMVDYARLVAATLEDNKKYEAGLRQDRPFRMTEGLAESLIESRNAEIIQSAPQIADAGARESALVLADALLEGPRNGAHLHKALPNEVAVRLLQRMAGPSPDPGTGPDSGGGSGSGGGGMGSLFYGAMATTGADVMGGAYMFSRQSAGVGMVPAHAAPNPRVGIAGMQRMPGEQATVLEGGPMMGGGGGFGPVGRQSVKESGNW